jgi:hypothetical protein
VRRKYRVSRTGAPLGAGGAPAPGGIAADATGAPSRRAGWGRKPPDTAAPAPIHHGELLLLLLLSFDIQFEATALRTLGLPLRPLACRL